MKKLSIIPLLPIIALLLCMVSVSSNASALSATVDRSTVSANETLTLQVRYTGQTQGQPDFNALNRDFEIVNQSSGNQYSVINGKVEAFTEWTLVLFPKKEGKLVIPSFKIAGEFSDAIVINVIPETKLPAGAKDVVFLETDVSTTEAHVQQQVILTYRFYYSVNVSDLNRTDLALDNVIMEELPRSNYQRVINQTPYQIAEFKYALFPQNSGSIEIPETTWTAQISKATSLRNFGFNTGRYELKRMRAEGKIITVTPQPAEYPANATWLPASSVTIEENWTKDPSKFKVGEPITRTLTLKAKGLMASQLPQINREPTDNRLKFYADQPVFNDEQTQQGFIGERKETVAVVVSEGGEIVVPEISIPWWDTGSNTVKYATLPERRFLVASDSSISKNNEVREQAANDTPDLAESIEPHVNQVNNASAINPFWRWLSAILALTTVALGIISYNLNLQLQKLRRNQNVRKRQSQTDQALSEVQAWKTLQNTANSGDLNRIREDMLCWGQKRWPFTPVHSLSDIRRLINDDTIRQQIQDLDAAMFGQNQETLWQPEILIKALKEWRQKDSQHNKSESKLAQLYPN